MSIVSGTIGAFKSSSATEHAADTAAEASRSATEAQEKMYNQQRKDFQPYMDIGYKGLGQITDYKDTSPSYDEAVTNRLGAYEEDPGTKAARALGTKSLAQQEQQRVGYSTPGASAARAAELSQKYDVSGYDKYKANLATRYNTLRGESGSEYDKMMNLVKVGQGAASSVSSAGSQLSGQYGTAAEQTGRAATAAGQSQAALWSGLGGASANTASAAISGYNAGKTAGLWGTTSTAAPAATAAYQGTMVESAAPAYEWAAASYGG